MEDMNPAVPIKKRPLLMTIFCVWGFIGLPFSMFAILMPATRDQLIQQYGNFSMVDLLVSFMLGAIGLIGLWKMKKWGLYSYIAMAIFSTGASIYLGIPFNMGYIMPFVMVAIGWINRARMS